MSVQLCCYCQKFLRGCFILCHDCCHSPPVYFCLECFSSGAEGGRHRSTHDYQVINESSLRMFGWNSSDVQALLDAIDFHSFDNWKEISKNISCKSAEDCQNFYTNYFINGSIGKETFNLQEPSITCQDHTKGATVHSSPMVGDLSIKEQQELGYMPLRDEFEVEYGGEIEGEVKELGEVDEDDVDRAYKLMRVETYRERLKERERRKKVAKEMNIFKKLSSPKTPTLSKKKYSKEERDMQDRWKMYVRFHADGDDLLTTFIREKRLIRRVEELVEYRKSGLNKLIDCKEFDNAKLMRVKKIETMSKMGSAGQTKSALTHSILSKKERKICKSFNISPPLYLSLKMSLLQNNNISTSVSRRIKRISEFLKANNWIVT